MAFNTLLHLWSDCIKSGTPKFNQLKYCMIFNKVKIITLLDWLPGLSFLFLFQVTIQETLCEAEYEKWLGKPRPESVLTRNNKHCGCPPFSPTQHGLSLAQHKMGIFLFPFYAALMNHYTEILLLLCLDEGPPTMSPAGVRCWMASIRLQVLPLTCKTGWKSVTPLHALAPLTSGLKEASEMSCIVPSVTTGLLL